MGFHANTMVRVVRVPAPILSAGAPLPPNHVVSVVLQPGERVEWTWTRDANGGSYVSGYAIKPAQAVRRRKRNR
jgi:hypothetical protein